jgi:hypothetical protein
MRAFVSTIDITPQPIQSKLLVTDTNETSTALVPIETPVEKVEGTIDLSEEMFPEIPADIKPVRPVLDYSSLVAMRRAFVYYARNAPLDGTSTKLSHLMKRFFRE